MKRLYMLLMLSFIFSCSSDENIPDDENPSFNWITDVYIEPIGKNLSIGDTYKLQVTIEPKNVVGIEYPQLIWSSSNPSVVSVDNEGVITVKDKGIVKIQVSVAKYKSEIPIDVANSLFGYVFGSTMKEVNPQIKISDEFAYNWAAVDFSTPLRTFNFKNDRLEIISNCYDPYGSYYNLFLENVNVLNPPQEITVSLTQFPGSTRFIIDQDSLSWTYNDLNILIRNGTIPIYEKDSPLLIVEYSKID